MISSFVFEASRNPALATDVVCSVADTGAPAITPAEGVPAPTGLITATVPFGTNVSALIPTAVSADIIYPENIEKDFASPQLYSVVYGNSSVKVYYVLITIAADTTPEVITLDSCKIWYLANSNGEQPVYRSFDCEIDHQALTFTFTAPTEFAPGGVPEYSEPVGWSNGTERSPWHIEYTATCNASFPPKNWTPTEYTYYPEGSSPKPGMSTDAVNLFPSNDMADGYFPVEIRLVGWRVSNGDWETRRSYRFVANMPAGQTITSSISDFRFEMAANIDLTADCIGVIDQLAKTITVTVPAGTVVTALKPTITRGGDYIFQQLRYGWVYPASAEARDFTHPVAYTVPNRAKSGETITYSGTTYLVTVEEAI